MTVVGLNLLWLVPGVVGGSEEYTIQLLRAVDRLDPDDIEIRIYAQPSLLEVHPDLGARFEVVEAPSTMSGKATRVLTETTWLARACRNDDLVHHAGSVAPVTSPRPYVFTVLDLQPLDHPENFSALKRAWLARMLPASIRRSEIVLCPSTFVRKSLLDRFGLEPDRVRVVSHWQEPVERGVLSSSKNRELVGSYGRYFLLPGIAYPHKRHVDLIEAFATLADEFADVSVVLTGGAGPQSTQLTDQIHRLNLGGRVHQLGRIPAADLDDLYRSATALVFPSEYEGFGIPVLEAMARGCPVITTDVTSLPEVAGEATLLVPPRSPLLLAGAMRRLLTEPRLAARLSESGVEQAEQFDWRSTGTALLDTYRDASTRATDS